MISVWNTTPDIFVCLHLPSPFTVLAGGCSSDPRGAPPGPDAAERLRESDLQILWADAELKTCPSTFPPGLSPPHTRTRRLRSILAPRPQTPRPSASHAVKSEGKTQTHFILILQLVRQGYSVLLAHFTRQRKWSPCSWEQKRVNLFRLSHPPPPRSSCSSRCPTPPCSPALRWQLCCSMT